MKQFPCNLVSIELVRTRIWEKQEAALPTNKCKNASQRGERKIRFRLYLKVFLPFVLVLCNNDRKVDLFIPIMFLMFNYNLQSNKCKLGNLHSKYENLWEPSFHLKSVPGVKSFHSYWKELDVDFYFMNNVKRTSISHLSTESVGPFILSIESHLL